MNKIKGYPNGQPFIVYCRDGIKPLQQQREG